MAASISSGVGPSSVVASLSSGVGPSSVATPLSSGVGPLADCGIGLYCIRIDLQLDVLFGWCL